MDNSAAATEGGGAASSYKDKDEQQSKPVLLRNHAYVERKLEYLKGGGMDIPKFPAPPALVSRSVSLDNRELTTATARQLQRSSNEFKRRPRSASWLVARKQVRQRSRRRANHVQPLADTREPTPAYPEQQLTAKLILTMTQTPDTQNDTADNHSTSNNEILEKIREGESPRTIKENQTDETDIICSASSCAEGKKLNYESHQESVKTPNLITKTIPETVKERLTEQSEEYINSVNNVMPITAVQTKLPKTTATQTQDSVLYRLRFFPTLRDIVDEENRLTDSKKPSRIFRYFRFLGRVALCQFGLAWLLTVWAVLGAGAFYITEGPRERQQVVELKDMQRDLAVGLATELRQLKADNDKELEPLWGSKVKQYVARHEKLLLLAVSSGYGEGGDNGQLWTFSGCVLFAISVLTTLGFGAPVPRTNAGRTVAVVFAAIGIPLHFLLVLNLGLLFAVALKRYSIRKRYPQEARDAETLDTFPMPAWVKVAPFLAIAVYYILGILFFGAARQRPFSDSLLFPLDFTAAGGLSTIAGYVRILYGLYLEGAVTLAAVTVAVIKVAATQSLTNIGLKYGLLIPA